MHQVLVKPTDEPQSRLLLFEETINQFCAGCTVTRKECHRKATEYTGDAEAISNSRGIQVPRRSGQHPGAVSGSRVPDGYQDPGSC